MYSQLIFSSSLWVTDNIPGSPQYFECLSSSWVFILVWMDLKGNGGKGCMSKGENFHIRNSLLVINSGIQMLELHTHLDSQLSVGLLQLSLSGMQLHTKNCKGVKLILWDLSQRQQSLQLLAWLASPCSAG